MEITAENVREYAGKKVNYFGDICYLVGISKDKNPSALIVKDRSFGDSWGYRGVADLEQECEIFAPSIANRCNQGYYVNFEDIFLQEERPAGRVAAWIPQQPQSQSSLTDQLEELLQAANRLGLYDAADYLGNINRAKAAEVK